MGFQSIGKRESLPEKVAGSIKESILSGEWNGGDPLPTEPDLEKQFGVSRIVIRDAVRILKTQGLIEVVQGKGMFVTHSKMEAFNEALLIFLRREKATVWDVEQFEKIFVPQIFAVANQEASAAEIKNVKSRAAEYLASFKRLTESDGKETGTKSKFEAQKRYDEFFSALLDCTHNKMIGLIGNVLHSLRKWRSIPEEKDIPLYPYEEAMVKRMLMALEAKEPQQAAEIIAKGTTFNTRVTKLLKETPVGESPEIPAELFYSTFVNAGENSTT